MASIVVNGDTSGAVTLSAPAVAGTVTVTLPSANGTMLTTASSTGVSGSAISSGTVAEAYGGTGTNTGYYGFKNRIINGAMVIDQRNAGGNSTANGYTVDRFQFLGSQSNKLTWGQSLNSASVPTGFRKYLGFQTGGSAYSVTSGDYFLCTQYVEGYNFADMMWGTASAKTTTLSFWVYSSLTGTFGGALVNVSYDTSYPFSYTINSANTWEYKTITVTGSTSGNWNTTNDVGVMCRFVLGCGTGRLSSTANAWVSGGYDGPTGSTSILATASATFYITGVQLEKGSTATSFDYRPFGTEVSLCQRYFAKSYDIATAVGTSTRNGYVNWNWQNLSNYGVVTIMLPVRMRAAPTSTNYNPDLTSTVGGRYYNGTSEVAFTGSMAGWTSYQSNIQFNKDGTNSTNMLIQWTADAEL